MYNIELEIYQQYKNWKVLRICETLIEDLVSWYW